MDGKIGQLMVLGLWLGAGGVSAQTTDGVAAIVNKRVITFSEIRREVEPIEKQYQGLYSGLELVEKVKEARLNALKSLIERELIIQEFTDKGYFIPDNVIEERIRDIVSDQYENDRSALIRTLQSNGVSLSNFKETIKNQIIVQAMRARNVSQAVIVSPFQIEQYYQDNVREFVRPDQVRMRMIFMKRGLFLEERKRDDGASEQVDPQHLVMEELLRKVETGSDFASLAASYSESPQRANGGDMGWVTDSSLRREISDAVFKLRPGQNSGIIETDEGYYILLVEEVRKATVVALPEVRESIETVLLQQERERLQQEWLDSLRAKAFIKMFF